MENMRDKKVKLLEKSKLYKKVWKRNNITKGSSFPWFASINGSCKGFKTEREAGKWVDLYLIDKGKEPINILKRK